MLKFNSLNLSDKALKFTELNNFSYMSEIQAKVLPRALKNKNLIAISRTGSGKTHAFLIPAFEKVDISKNYCQVLIVVPTNELALQIYNRSLVYKQVDPNFNIKLLAVQNYQLDNTYNNAHVIITTFSKVKELFLDQLLIRLENCHSLIMDEIDMLLDKTNLEILDLLLQKLKDVQIMCFSATINNQLEFLLKKYFSNIEVIKAELINKNIKHYAITCKHKNYIEKLDELLKLLNQSLTMIFVSSKKQIEEVEQLLRSKEFKFVSIHGDKSFRERKNILKLIEANQVNYIVCSDLAARGFDNQMVSDTISLGLPKDLTYYIHRSGRSARFDAKGNSYLLYQEQELSRIEQLINNNIEFDFVDLKNNQLKLLKNPFVKIRKTNKDIEIVKKLSRKKQKIKPNYKKKFANQVAKVKQQKKRELIKKDIARQKKERAKAKSLEKYNSQG